jgi:hypothetical protein
VNSPLRNALAILVRKLRALGRASGNLFERAIEQDVLALSIRQPTTSVIGES